MELAEPALAELRQGVEPHVDVVGDEQVEPAVAVVVGERRTGRPSRIADARLRGDVRERAVAVVAIQPVRAEAGDVQIVPAVVVEVGGDGAHAPPGVADARLVGDVDERAVAAIPPQLAARASRSRLRVATVGALTRYTSSRPSLSKSKSATPPLIDSRMYFLSGDETCENVIPLALVMSVNVTRSAARRRDRDRRTRPADQRRDAQSPRAS